MYQYLLLALLYGCQLTAAGQECITVPKTLDQVPRYCVEFLTRSLEAPIPIGKRDLLDQVDSWQDIITLTCGWDESGLVSVLEGVRATFNAGDTSSLGDSEKIALYEAAIKEVQSGWVAASVENFSFSRLKNPDEYVLFVNETEQVCDNAAFVKFLIDRLGMWDIAKCRSSERQVRVGIGLKKERKTYVLIKKESVAQFQAALNFHVSKEWYFLKKGCIDHIISIYDL